MDLPNILGGTAELHLIVRVVLQESPHKWKTANIMPAKYADA